jgi:Mn-dependent DtxR family transcriptional regulator
MEQRLEDTLRFIVRYKTDYDGTSPSLDDVMKAFGVCKATAKTRVDALIELGLLERMPNRPRALLVIGGEWSYYPPNGSE